jgi:hypothetical protein
MAHSSWDNLYINHTQDKPPAGVYTNIIKEDRDIG